MSRSRPQALTARLSRRLMRGPLGRWVREAVLYHPGVFEGSWDRVEIKENVVLCDTLFNTESGIIRIESDAFFGHGVSLLTGTHDYRLLDAQRQQAVPRDGRDIVVGAGAWIGSKATIIGPCHVGRHAVVAAGAVVIADVADFAIVAGVPARVVGTVTPLKDADSPTRAGST